jgi:hypothetical protein
MGSKVYDREVQSALSFPLLSFRLLHVYGFSLHPSIRIGSYRGAQSIRSLDTGLQKLSRTLISGSSLSKRRFRQRPATLCLFPYTAVHSCSDRTKLVKRKSTLLIDRTDL